MLRHARSLKGDAGQAYSFAFSPDGKRLASSGDNKRIKLWDINTGREMMSLVGHSQSVSGLAFSPDGSFIVSSSDDKTIRFWRAATEAEAQARRGQ